MLTYAAVILAYADVYWRMLTHAAGCTAEQSLSTRMLTYAARTLAYADVC
jgi:hypothetical protein